MAILILLINFFQEEGLVKSKLKKVLWVFLTKFVYLLSAVKKYYHSKAINSYLVKYLMSNKKLFFVVFKLKHYVKVWEEKLWNYKVLLNFISFSS